MKLKMVWIALVVTGWCLPAGAQTHHGSIRGLVTDITRTPLAGVSVKLLHEDTSDRRQVSTDEYGQFTFSALPPGPYRLEIEHSGYKQYVHTIPLQVNQERRIDPALEVGALTEEVFVVAPAVPLERDSPAIGTVIENRQVTGLPLDGRNFLELSLLVPGVAPAAPGSAGSVRGDFGFHASGGREDANSYVLDGVYNVDPKLNAIGVSPPVDAVQEFKILTSTYDASFGRNAGAQVNVVLQAGTNTLKGTVYEFLRSGALDARNFFAPRKEEAPDYYRNQFGFSVGGPVSRNRSFFFADYEGTRVREGITRVSNVPTRAERDGDFSQSLFRRPVNPFTRQPFADGRIPPFLIDPIARAIVALYPEPNRSVPFQNFVSSPLRRDRVDQFDVRLDQVLGASSDLTIRFSFADRDLFEPFSGAGFSAVPGFGTNVPRRAQNLAISETRVLSPTLLNEIRFGYARVASAVWQENRGRSLNRQVGLPELSGSSRDFGLSFITVSGLSPLGDEYNNPQESVTNAFQVIDTVTYARRRHLLKFGGEARILRQDAFRDVQARGFLTFSDQAPFTGNALADLLLGLPVVTGGARLDNPQRLRTESCSFFVHDSFWIASNLTLSAGLRYEYISSPVDAHDRANVYDTATRSLVQVGTRGVPRSGYEPHRNNWAPRIGISWMPDGGGRTVIRGGYGIYYDQSALAPGEGLYFNAPYFDFNLYFPLEGLPLRLSDPFPQFYPLVLPDSALAFQRDLKTASLQHWQLSMQRQIGKSRAVEIAYVGSKGSHLLAGRDINQPRPSPQPRNPRPDFQFDDITLLESRASSRYNSFQLRLQQRLESALSLLGSYTWSKSTDDASGFFASAGDPNFPQDSFNLAAERGRSNFDVRHRLSIGFSYELPVGRGVLADWELHGIATLQSGRPFTVALLPEIDNSNTGRSILGFGANDRPNRTGTGRVSDPEPDRWFDQNAFAFPPTGTFGNSGRNILDGPGYQNISLALLKYVKLGGARRLQLRAEAFNVFNRTNLDLPDIFLGSPTFGRVLSAQSPRHVQFGVKFLF